MKKGVSAFRIILPAAMIAVVALSGSFPAHAGGNPDSTRMTEAAAKFGKDHGECAAVLVDARDCRIVFVYNKELAIHRRFPPGSLMKPLSAAVLYENGLNPSVLYTCCGHFVPERSFNLSDEKRFNLSRDPVSGRKSFPCSLYEGHGKVSLRDALIRSCNAYFLNAVQSCPSFYEKLVSSWKIDDPLLPGMTAGLSAAKNISPFQQISSSIGEGTGVHVSALKIAENYAALFEGTPLMEPYTEGFPRVRFEICFREETLTVIRSALSGTVKEGTLEKLRIPAGCSVLAGKTGTSTDMKDKSLHHGWNVLWLEKEGKRYVLVTFVMRGSGSKEAAALSSSILEGI